MVEVTSQPDAHGVRSIALNAEDGGGTPEERQKRDWGSSSLQDACERILTEACNDMPDTKLEMDGAERKASR